jgi:hypothetical protein
MNKIRQASLRLQFFFTFVVFLAVLGLAYLYRQQIVEIVLVPILYLLWVVNVALQIFGQRCIWTAALIIALLLSLRFFQQKEKPIKGLDRTVYSRGPAVGRIQFWRRRVRVNTNAIFAASYRRPAMRQLIIRALAYRENSNVQEIEKKLRSGQMNIPAEISNILGLEDQSVESRGSIGLIEFIKLRIGWITERFITPKFVPDPQIEKVANYLENLMEVDNDARNQ